LVEKILAELHREAVPATVLEVPGTVESDESSSVEAEPEVQGEVPDVEPESLETEPNVQESEQEE
jgi:hypothetical protein